MAEWADSKRRAETSEKNLGGPNPLAEIPSQKPKPEGTRKSAKNHSKSAKIYKKRFFSEVAQPLRPGLHTLAARRGGWVPVSGRLAG